MTTELPLYNFQLVFEAMCDHDGFKPFTKSDPPSDPCDSDHCHIYYVHQYGEISRQTNVLFPDSELGIPSGERDQKVKEHVNSGEVVETSREIVVDGSEINKEEKDRLEKVKNKVAKAFCGDNRLTLV